MPPAFYFRRTRLVVPQTLYFWSMREVVFTLGLGSGSALVPFSLIIETPLFVVSCLLVENKERVQWLGTMAQGAIVSGSTPLFAFISWFFFCLSFLHLCQ